MIDMIAILFFAGVPLLLVLLAQKLSLIDKVGLVVVAFGGGILLSALGVIDILFSETKILDIQTSLTEVSIALAIPLLVFSMDVKASFQLAGRALLSMFFAVLTVTGLASVLAYEFSHSIEDIWQVAGMSVGAYTGGGPNMAAIKVAIDGDQSVFVKMTSYDILLSAIYLLFIVTLAKPLFSRFLPIFQDNQSENDCATNKAIHDQQAFSHLSEEGARTYGSIIKRGRRLESIYALLCAALVVGASVILSSLLPKSWSGSVTIIAITSFGLACSFIPFVRALKNAFHLGMFLVLVFCFTMGSMTDLALFSQLDLALFSYIGLVLAGSLLVHAILCRLFKIDVDTFLIASSASIMSVPFIPVVAGALSNKKLIVPGFAIAILGYVLGNYLGVMVAHLLKNILA